MLNTKRKYVIAILAWTQHMSNNAQTVSVANVCNAGCKTFMAADWKMKEHDFFKISLPFLVKMKIKFMYYLKDMKEHCNYSIWYKFINSCILKTIGINVEKIIHSI